MSLSSLLGGLAKPDPFHRDGRRVASRSLKGSLITDELQKFRQKEALAQERVSASDSMVQSGLNELRQQVTVQMKGHPQEMKHEEQLLQQASDAAKQFAALQAEMNGPHRSLGGLAQAQELALKMRDLVTQAEGEANGIPK